VENDAVIEPLARELLDPSDMLGREIRPQLDHHPAVVEVQIERILEILRRGASR
jgi:hypothetical protein